MSVDSVDWSQIALLPDANDSFDPSRNLFARDGVTSKKSASSRFIAWTAEIAISRLINALFTV